MRSQFFNPSGFNNAKSIKITQISGLSDVRDADSLHWEVFDDRVQFIAQSLNSTFRASSDPLEEGSKISLDNIKGIKDVYVVIQYRQNVFLPSQVVNLHYEVEDSNLIKTTTVMILEYVFMGLVLLVPLFIFVCVLICTELYLCLRKRNSSKHAALEKEPIPSTSKRLNMVSSDIQKNCTQTFSRLFKESCSYSLSQHPLFGICVRKKGDPLNIFSKCCICIVIFFMTIVASTTTKSKTKEFESQFAHLDCYSVEQCYTMCPKIRDHFNASILVDEVCTDLPHTYHVSGKKFEASSYYVLPSFEHMPKKFEDALHECDCSQVDEGSLLRLPCIVEQAYYCRSKFEDLSKDDDDRRQCESTDDALLRMVRRPRRCNFGWRFWRQVGILCLTALASLLTTLYFKPFQLTIIQLATTCSTQSAILGSIFLVLAMPILLIILYANNWINTLSLNVKFYMLFVDHLTAIIMFIVSPFLTGPIIYCVGCNCYANDRELIKLRKKKYKNMEAHNQEELLKEDGSNSEEFSGNETSQNDGGLDEQLFVTDPNMMNRPDVMGYDNEEESNMYTLHEDSKEETEPQEIDTMPTMDNQFDGGIDNHDTPHETTEDMQDLPDIDAGQDVNYQPDDLFS